MAISGCMEKGCLVLSCKRNLHLGKKSLKVHGTEIFLRVVWRCLEWGVFRRDILVLIISQEL